jgi:hypothetical protein
MSHPYAAPTREAKRQTSGKGKVWPTDRVPFSIASQGGGLLYSSGKVLLINLSVHNVSSRDVRRPHTDPHYTMLCYGRREGGR